MNHYVANFVQTVLAVLCAFVIVGMLVFAFDVGASLPDVWFSYSTNECVKVINYVEGQNYSCENLPTKFYHVWVE